MLYLHCATALTPQRRILNAAILIQNGIVQAIAPAEQLPAPTGARIVRLPEHTAAPGLLDSQINGAFGYDFTEEPESIWHAAQKLPRYGITAFLPTIISSPPETYARALAALRHPPTNFRGARPLGWHFEGPYLNPQAAGAHNPAHIRPPNLRETTNWTRANGVRLVTLAPEQPNALALLRQLQRNGVSVSAGHTTATFEQAQTALTHGIRSATHLFNAMPPLHHRTPGIVGAFLMDKRVRVGIIADGIHLHPQVIRLLWKVRGGLRVYLVSDGIAALGLPAGAYTLGGTRVISDGVRAQRENGTLAGSILPLDADIRNLMHFTGCTLQAAIGAATREPARLLRETTLGSLQPRAPANVILLNAANEVTATLISGEWVYCSATLYNLIENR